MGKTYVFRLITAFFILLCAALLAVRYVADVERFPFSFGLDIAGGTQLTYDADVSGISEEEISGRMSALQRVIERRVNALGVSEPSIRTATGSALTGLPVSHRLVVELPGVTDINEATQAIGETPYLEFKIYNEERQEFEGIGLQGGHVVSSDVQFLPGFGGTLTNEPVVLLHFNGEGADIFADVTRTNVGKPLGIFLDGALISSPVIVDAILGGTTQIEGNFTIETAGALADNLNFGALPLPIELSETRTVDPSLGKDTVSMSAFAGVLSMLLVGLLFLLVYRFVGIVAVLALSAYAAVVLSIFKAVPIVLTAAGLAGFVMSIGFAVDANVLIFERMREEIRRGVARKDAVESGCARAWSAIRDANITSIIIASLLFWFGTSVVKGFAFAFIIGVLLSMLSAYLLTRLLLRISSGMLTGKMRKWYIQ